MITNTDIKKLESIFITKEDAKQFATKTELQNVKSELKTEMIVLRAELKRDMKEFKEEMMTRFDRLVEQIREIVTQGLEKQVEHDNKLKLHAIRLNDHEERIQYLER